MRYDIHYRGVQWYLEVHSLAFARKTARELAVTYGSATVSRADTIGRQELWHYQLCPKGRVLETRTAWKP